jgi:hypothetical protein
MLGALQTEVAAEASISFDSRWSCCEPLASKGDSKFDLGSIIADKPMWAIFKVENGLQSSALTLNYRENGLPYTLMFSPVDGQVNGLEICEQELRCLTGITLNRVAELIQKRKLPEAKALLLKTLAELANSTVVSRPLVILMKAQLDETLEGVNTAVQRHNLPLDLLYRTTSLGGNYSAQRGVTQMADGQTPGVFSSPAQVLSSQVMCDQYSQDPLIP